MENTNVIDELHAFKGQLLDDLGRTERVVGAHAPCHAVLSLHGAHACSRMLATLGVKFAPVVHGLIAFQMLHMASKHSVVVNGSMHVPREHCVHACSWVTLRRTTCKLSTAKLGQC